METAIEVQQLPEAGPRFAAAAMPAARPPLGDQPRGLQRACWVSSRLTPGFGCRAHADKRCLGGPQWWLERGKFFGRGAALQREGEAFIVVPGLPAPKGGGGRLEVREALPAPELLLIDPMAAFDFAVLLRPAGPNVPVADPGGFDPQHEGKGELWPVVTLQLSAPMVEV